MKGNELDDLFKKKLGHHKLTPPAGGWDQIEKNLSGKNSKGIVFWLSIAAGIVIVFTLGWLLIPAQGEMAAPAQLAEVAESPAKKQQTTPQESITETAKVEVAKAEVIQPKVVQPEPMDIPVQPDLDQSITLKAETQTVNPEETFEAPSTFVRDLPIKISKLSLKNVVASSALTPNINRTPVLPLDISLKMNYSEEGYEEIKSRRRFRVLNGIISIAKGVNKSNIGFEGIRNAKNGFVSDGLKYGTNDKVDEDKATTDSKDASNATNAQDDELNR